MKKTFDTFANLECSKRTEPALRKPHEYGKDEPTHRTLLTYLAKAAELNSKRSKCGHRYDPKLKLFCTFLYIIGGRHHYETLRANMPDSMPSITTVFRCAKDSGGRTEEAKVRFMELSLQLKNRSLPSHVWLSEDATRLKAAVQYDAASNLCVGFVLQLNELNMVSLKRVGSKLPPKKLSRATSKTSRCRTIPLRSWRSLLKKDHHRSVSAYLVPTTSSSQSMCRRGGSGFKQRPSSMELQ